MKSTVHSRLDACSVAISLLMASASTSCPYTNARGIAVPVYACILKGTGWTTNAANSPEAITQLVIKLVYDANENVWTTGADITMVPEIDHGGDVPVIDDPDVSSGKQGDVVAGTSEGELVANSCRTAWGDALVPGGLVIVVAHDLINTDGSRTGQSGFTEPYDAVMQRNSGNDVCAFPRHIVAGDVRDRYLIIMDPTILGLKGEHGNGIPFVVLAHEFGHTLMLSHGDGLDNDKNGQFPPDAGRRAFDQSCDPVEYSQYDLDPNRKTASLMDAVAGYITTLTPLQVELARTVAPLLPGAVGPKS